MTTNFDDDVTFDDATDNDFRNEDRATQRPAREVTNLDRLRASLAETIKVESCNILVPLRKGLSLDIEVENLTINRMEAYTERATKSSGGNRRSRRANSGEKKLDQLYLASLVLHNHCVGIRFNDEIVNDEQGNPLRLDDPQFLSMLNIIADEDVVAVMTELFAMEIHVVNAFMEVQEYLEDTTEDRRGDENPLAQ